VTAESRHLQTHHHYLNVEEQQRASRFLAEKDQHMYIIAHGLLRLILGSYLQLPPANVAFIEHSQKKPALAPVHQSDLKFNLSHSGQKVLIAVTKANEVGADIEIIQPQSRMHVAERYYSASEVEQLRSLAPEEQTAMFYRIWSKKEAIVKANGQGLAEQLSAFSVSLSDKPETISLKDHHWFLYPLNIDPAYAAAVASAQPAATISVWEFSDHTPHLQSTIHP
jgi:4'-phosphopantetheinyl transferase